MRRSAGLQPIQHINHLPQAAVIAAVNVKRDERQLQTVVVLDFIRRWFDCLNFSLDDDVGDFGFVVAAAFKVDKFQKSTVSIPPRRRTCAGSSGSRRQHNFAAPEINARF